MHIFDNWGNQEEDVTLDQPASISFKMDADELGGVEEVLQAYENDGFSIYAQNGENDEWTMVEFVLETDDQGVVSITVSGVSNLGSFAATTNAEVFRQLTATPTPQPTPTPTPAPSLGPSGPRSTPVPMVAPMSANRPAPPASVSKAQQSASSTESTPTPSQAATPASISVAYVPAIRLGPPAVGADTDDRGSSDGSDWRRPDRRSSLDKEALVSHQVKVRLPESARLCASVVAPFYGCHHGSSTFRPIILLAYPK